MTSVSCKLDSPVQAICLSPSQRELAVACRDHLRVLALSYFDIVDSLLLQCESRSVNYNLTDACWSTRQPNYIATATTTGSVVVFDVNEKKQFWTSGDGTRAVNKLSWNSLEENVFAAGSQDEAVRIYDIRMKKDPCQSVLQSRSGPCRDVQFNKFNSSILASIYDNGRVVCWDRRKIDNNILSKIDAHTASGLVLAWSNAEENILASGGRDKTIKIWDFKRPESSHTDDLIKPSNNYLIKNNNNIENQSQPYLPAHSSDSVYHKPIHVIHTPTAINHISWRPNEFHHDCQLAASGTDGDIYIFDINDANIPVCVLHGLSDVCVGFEWLDTPYTSDNHNHISGASYRSQSSTPGNFHRSVALPFGSPTSSKNSTSQQHHLITQNSDLGSGGSGEGRGKGWGFWQHVISAGKDGMVAVQDLRRGSFPRHHMSRHCLGISPRGDVVVHLGTVCREDVVGLHKTDNLASALTKSLVVPPGKQCWFLGPYPPCYAESTATTGSATIGASIENSGARNSRLDSTDKLSLSSIGRGKTETTQGEIGTGELLHATSVPIDIPGDPTVVRKLALRYKIYANPEEGGVHAVCVHNLSVTEEFELPSYSALWRAMLVLIRGLAQEISYTDFGFENVSFYQPVIESLLIQLQDAGDVQHLVTICEILRSAESERMIILSKSNEEINHSNDNNHNSNDNSNTKMKITDVLNSLITWRKEESYVSYWELLRKLKLYDTACELSLNSGIQLLADRSKQGVEMRQNCGKCGKEISRLEDAQANPNGSGTRVRLPWCSKCKECVGLCVICHRPVCGVLVWCQICGHGGHSKCVQKWFSGRKSQLMKLQESLHSRNNTIPSSTAVKCPSGCGHHCLL